MNWFKENPFLAALTGGTIVLVGVGVFLLTQAMSAYSTTQQTYLEQLQKLHTLQNRVPFPNAENLEKVRAQQQAYETELLGFRAKLVAMELPFDPSIGPQQFQDNLRRAVNEVKDKANALKVTLPENFYLGFDQYANSLPPEKAAPALERQLAVIRTVVMRLIDFRVRSIDELKRQILPEEGPAKAAAPPQDAEKQPKKEVLARYPFDITFTAEQAKFRVAFNALLSSDQFLIVRSIKVENSNPVGPARGQSTQPTTASSVLGTLGVADPTSAPNPNDLNVILGRELVKVSVRVEMIDFEEPPAPKESK